MKRMSFNGLSILVSLGLKIVRDSSIKLTTHQNHPKTVSKMATPVKKLTSLKIKKFIIITSVPIRKTMF